MDSEVKGPTVSQYLAGLPDDVETLKHELMMANARYEALRLAVEMGDESGKDHGVDLQGLAAKHKTGVVNTMRRTYPLQTCLTVMDMAQATYYYHRCRITRPWKHEHLIEPVAQIAASSRYTYGSLRIWHQLRHQGVRVSEKVVRQVMPRANIQVHYGRGARRKYNSYQGEITPAPPNLVARNFHADAPGGCLSPTLASSTRLTARSTSPR